MARVRNPDDALSTRQAQIAAFVVAGKTNREIARALSLSPRTVETHLATIYNKLAVGSRVELAALLHSPPASEKARMQTRPTKPATNIPAPRTSLIGREAAVTEIVAALAASRLVTVTGTAGVGKTQLALAVGSALAVEMPAGAWLAEFATIARGAYVTPAIARALAVEESPGTALVETLATTIGDRTLLLVLDNCEHVIADAALVADALLRDCPNLRILASSREPLHIPGERTYRLASLQSPPRTPRSDAHEIARYPAVALFVERARAASRGFALTDQNAPHVAEICRRLDGIPLAIELAAARVDVMPVATLSSMLDDRFRILTGGSRTAVARQQTMRGLIDWSYDLLCAAEQRLFARLAVFAGSFTLEAAGSIDVDDPDLLGRLSSLVDKSLVVAETDGREPRFRLLESTREHAKQKLAERGEATDAARRHATAYLEIAQTLEREYEYADDARWYARTEAELENVRAALEWALIERADVLLGQRLVAALRPMWTVFALAEGRRWLRLAVATIDERTADSVRAHLDLTAGWLSYLSLEYQDTVTISGRALERYTALGDALGSTRAKFMYGLALLNVGETVLGRAVLRDALAAARKLDNPRLIALTLCEIALSGTASSDNDPSTIDEARANIMEAIEIWAAAGNPAMIVNGTAYLAEFESRAGNVERGVEILTPLVTAQQMPGLTGFKRMMLSQMLAEFLTRCERWHEARSRVHEALDAATDLQHPTYIALALGTCAALLVRSGIDLPNAPPDAARLLGYVDARLASIGYSRPADERRDHERLIAQLSSQLGHATVTHLSADGARLSEAQARAIAAAILTSTVVDIPSSGQDGR